MSTEITKSERVQEMLHHIVMFKFSEPPEVIRRIAIYWK
jgi:hypothetical protein